MPALTELEGESDHVW